MTIVYLIILTGANVSIVTTPHTRWPLHNTVGNLIETADKHDQRNPGDDNDDIVHVWTSITDIIAFD